MNKFIATFCIIGTALVLSACETSTTHSSGASHAHGRTAGNVEGVQAAQPTRSERVFRRIQSK